MIKGIGLDIVELPRLKNIITRTPRFVNKVLTMREYEIYQSLKPHRQLEFLGGRFAAKEAYAKALGTGIGEHCRLHDIEIIANDLGAPVLYFCNELTSDFISITHTEKYAAAQVIILV
ncbi:MAG TPA: holo-ACP synthase [Metalysinibacillus jejuensis]|uniref:Holo-[acyl-carrier-protein] synthase n=1 Tax=Metalysinibacillus jejuensis TaxID=914327 RepID=A0A921NC00_9BACL|nr:holo-ACP synthase [Metalysinibacillus jejuensis]HJH11392.1 holo-ACP synthase [Metalysinibacillus jejuensis]